MYVVDQVEIQCVDARCILLNQCIWDRLCIHTHFHLACTGSQWLNVIATLVCIDGYDSISTQIVVEIQYQVLACSTNTVQTYFVPTGWQLAEVIGLGVIQFYSSPTAFWSFRNNSIRIYHDFACSLHTHVAGVILWQIFLVAFVQLFQLSQWEVFLDTLNHFFQVVDSNVLLEFVFECQCYAACIWQELAVLLEQSLYIHTWDIFAIFQDGTQQLLIRNSILILCQVSYQCLYREVFLAVC